MTKINVSDRFAGVVSLVLDFGVEVKLEGVDGSGLLHVSRMRGGSISGRNRRLSQLAKGDAVEVEVVEIKFEGKRRKLSLSERWHDEVVVGELKAGERVDAVVVKTLESGVIATIASGIAAGVDGFLHVSELSGVTREARDKALSGIKLGETLKVEVLSVSKDAGEVRVKLSQRVAAVREKLSSTFASGTAHTGKVLKRTTEGFVVTFGTLEGFLPENELGGASASSIKVGGNVRAKVVGVDDRLCLRLTRKGL
jgi:Ribosomal protein S1